MIAAEQVALSLAAMSALTFGTAKVLDKKGLMGTNSLVGVLYTLVVGPPILLLVSLITGELFFPYNYNMLTVSEAAVAGIFAYALGTILLFASIQIVGAGRAAVMTSSQVIFAPALSILVLGETTCTELIIGTAFIFTGLILVALSTPRAADNVIDTKKFRRGYAIGILSGFFWGASQLFTRTAVVNLGSPTIVSLISYIFAIFGMAVLLLFSSARKKTRIGNTSRLFLSGSGIFRVVAALSRASALSLAAVVLVIPIISISPLITLLISYLLIQRFELINRRVVIGATFVVMGAIIIALYA